MQVRYAVIDEAVVSAVENGRVTARGRGLTTVVARALGKVATAQLIVVDERAGEDHPHFAANNFIDEHVFDKLRQVNIVPFPVAPDRVFVRRVYLDAIGGLPTPEETATFVDDSRPDKRARLIDGMPAISEKIVVPLKLFPELDHQAALPNTLYSLYQSVYGINIAVAKEELSAILSNRNDEKELGLKPGSPILRIERIAMALRKKCG